MHRLLEKVFENRIEEVLPLDSLSTKALFIKILNRALLDIGMHPIGSSHYEAAKKWFTGKVGVIPSEYLCEFLGLEELREFLVKLFRTNEEEAKKRIEKFLVKYNHLKERSSGRNKSTEIV
jgi:hypothetical protein